MGRPRAVAIWAALAAAMGLPLWVAAQSPLLAWREPIYIGAGFAGIAAFALLLLHPLLTAGRLPGLSMPRGRGLHRWVGGLLIASILAHVGGLWITSPPDVVDALLFASPTPFSAWGVIAMWALFAAALLAVLRRRLRPRIWRLGHTGLAIIVVLASILHALLIEGTMGPLSKGTLCALVLAALLKTLADLRLWGLLRRPR